MRSASRGATLKHNPRTETWDKRRGRPSIINHVGHYLIDSLSHTHICTHRNIPTYQRLPFLSLSPSVFIYQPGKLFYRFSSHPFKLPHNFAGQTVTIAVIRMDSASLPGSIVCFQPCVCARVSLGSSDSLRSVPGKRHQFIWHGESLCLFN